MYLSILRLWNFRKYGAGADNAPGLEVHFHEGVNVLIGENDSGKTTIIDAIRYALKTQSGEFIQCLHLTLTLTRAICKYQLHSMRVLRIFFE